MASCPPLSLNSPGPDSPGYDDAGMDGHEVSRRLKSDVYLSKNWGTLLYRTLREMARTLPWTQEDLLDIVGLGEITLRKYGQAFLKLLSETTSP
jgi:hypothetical protein